MNGLIVETGMTRVFDAAGSHVPVTVIEAGPCPSSPSRGRVELGFRREETKNAPKKRSAGHAKKGGVETTPRVIRRFERDGEAAARRQRRHRCHLRRRAIA